MRPEYNSPLNNRRMLLNRRRTSPKQWACRFVLVLFGVAIGLQISLATAPKAVTLAKSEQLLNSLERITTNLEACFPVDLGEKSILFLVDIDGVLKLNCEKHEIVSGPVRESTAPSIIRVPMIASVVSVD